MAYLLAGGGDPSTESDVENEEEAVGSVPAKKRKHGSLSSLTGRVGKSHGIGNVTMKSGDSLSISSSATTNTSEMNLISPFTNHLVGRRGARVKAEANPNRKPTKAWEKMYQKYAEYVKEKGVNDVDSSKENADLLRWTRQQQHEYRYLKEGRASSMFQVKIDKLRSIGFEFKYVTVSFVGHFSFWCYVCNLVCLIVRVILYFY